MALNQNVTLRSPEMLAPARIPVAAGKKMANTEKKFSFPPPVSFCLKSGAKLSMKISPVKRRER